MWQRFRVLRVKRQKVSLYRQPSAYTVPAGVGGLRSHPTPVTWHGNRQSMQHLWWVITLAGALLQFAHLTDEFVVHNMLQYYFGTGEDDELPGSIPDDTCPSFILLQLLIIFQVNKWYMHSFFCTVESLQSHCIHTQFHWPVVHSFASRHEGPGFNPQGGTYVQQGFSC